MAMESLGRLSESGAVESLERMRRDRRDLNALFLDLLIRGGRADSGVDGFAGVSRDLLTAITELDIDGIEHLESINVPLFQVSRTDAAAPEAIANDWMLFCGAALSFLKYLFEGSWTAVVLEVGGRCGCEAEILGQRLENQIDQLRKGQISIVARPSEEEMMAYFESANRINEGVLEHAGIQLQERIRNGERCQLCMSQ